MASAAPRQHRYGVTRGYPAGMGSTAMADLRGKERTVFDQPNPTGRLAQGVRERRTRRRPRARGPARTTRRRSRATALRWRSRRASPMRPMGCSATSCSSSPGSCVAASTIGREHGAGTDRVDPHPAVAVLERGRLGEPEHAVLRRHVRRLPRVPDEAGARRGVDDRAAASPAGGGARTSCRGTRRAASRPGPGPTPSSGRSATSCCAAATPALLWA